MNKREVFNKVKDHLLGQGTQSMDETGCCAYRGNDGMMCAVGCLITDEAYTIDIEGKSVEAGAVGIALEESGVTHIPLGLLKGLQYMHDSVEVEGWPERLDELERKYL